MSNPEHERDRSKEDSSSDFLDETGDQRPRANERMSGKESRYPVIRKPVPISESGALRAPNADAKGRNRSDASEEADAGDDFGFLDDIDLSPSGSSRNRDFEVDDDDWERPVGYDDDEPPRLWRRVALVISICALLTGGVLFSLPWLKQQGFAFDMPQELPFGLTLNLPFDIPGFGSKSAETTDDAEVVATAPESEPEPDTAEPVAEAAPSQPQAPSLGSRFRDSLAEVETFVANEQYEEAGQAIAGLDRSVYGYGATEFQALEARISEAQGATAAAAAAAEEEARAREAAETERARAETEAARVEEEQAAQTERERVQAAEAREAARVAAQARLDAQAAAEAERLAQVNQAAAQRRQTIAEQSASDRQATDRAVAEQRAENERRAEAQRQQEQTVARAPEQSAPAPVNGPITDADLQLVYGRFSDLAIAIETGNISDVISLTSRSSSRIQQFLQVFENSDFVSARITNVATRNASGSVTGTLSISGITRADGSTVDPPANLRSIQLISTREGSGWSLIDW